MRKDGEEKEQATCPASAGQAQPHRLHSPLKQPPDPGQAPAQEEAVSLELPTYLFIFFWFMER